MPTFNPFLWGGEGSPTKIYHGKKKGSSLLEDLVEQGMEGVTYSQFSAFYDANTALRRGQVLAWFCGVLQFEGTRQISTPPKVCFGEYLCVWFV